MNAVAMVRNRITTPTDHVCTKLYDPEYTFLGKSPASDAGELPRRKHITIFDLVVAIFMLVY